VCGIQDVASAPLSPVREGSTGIFGENGYRSLYLQLWMLMLVKWGILTRKPCQGSRKRDSDKAPNPYF